MRRLLCATCGAKSPPGTRLLYPADAEGQEEWGRFFHGAANQPTAEQRTVYINGEPTVLSVNAYTCDGCGAEIHPGDPCCAATVWVGDRAREPGPWEHEYLRQPESAAS